MKYIEKINLNGQDFVFIPPAATAEQIGGIKAENATDESVELKIDEQGKLYAPQYPDFSGKLDKNQGEDNADKVFVINIEGNLEPTEFKGGSDNRLIGNVEKIENANINDSYQAKIQNLKLYGKSTQGADPSPDNKQDITSINQFDITVMGKNLFDINKVETFNQGHSYSIINNGDGSITVNTASDSSGVVYNKKLSELANLKNGKTYTLTADMTGSEKKIYLYEVKLMWDFGTSKTITQEMLDSRVTFYASGENTSAIIANIQIELGDTATSYEPYQEQKITITPPQPMYSTLDGSIADEVDVEKGVYRYWLLKDKIENVISSVMLGSLDGDIQKYFTEDMRNESLVPISLNDQYDTRNLACTNYNANIESYMNGTDETFSLYMDATADFVGAINVNHLNENTAGDIYNFIKDFEIVYPLATPTEIPIDSEKLTALRNLYSYTGTTNFLCNAPISFNYEQSVDLVIKDLLSKIQTTGANLLYLNGK